MYLAILNTLHSQQKSSFRSWLKHATQTGYLQTFAIQNLKAAIIVSTYVAVKINCKENSSQLMRPWYLKHRWWEELKVNLHISTVLWASSLLVFTACLHKLFSSLPLGNFHVFFQLLIFFKINFFEKFIQEYHQSV